MESSLQNFAIAAGLFLVLMACAEIGFRRGKHRSQSPDAKAAGQIGTVIGALLGLLGLLLGFSFAAAGARFIERQDLIVTEANAIGTASLRADLLDEPHRSELRSALKAYTAHRIEVSARAASSLTAQDEADVARLQDQIWKTGMAGVAAKPHVMLGVLPPLNDVIDLHTTRVWAARKHIPMLVSGLLMACSMLSVGVLGYSMGLGGTRSAPLILSVAALIAATLWITYDLDHPRGGLLQLNDAPLKALKFDAGP